MTREAVVRIPHSLGQAEAQRRIVKGIGAMEREYGQFVSAVKTNWEGSRMNFHLSAMSQTVEGDIDVAEDYVEVRAQLPFLLALVAKKFLPKVEKTGQLLLK